MANINFLRKKVKLLEQKDALPSCQLHMIERRPGWWCGLSCHQSNDAPIVVAVLTVLLIACLFVGVSNAATYNIPAGDVAALIAAINTANDNSHNDTINLQGGIYPLISIDNSRRGANGLPRIKSAITINGHDATITAIGLFRIFDVTARGHLVLNRITIENGYASLGGGAIRNTGHVVIVRSTFLGNLGGEGGAIKNEGTVVISQSTFTDNSAGPAGGEDSGGAIRNEEGGTLSIVNSTFSNNAATDDGGAIWSIGRLKVSNSTFFGNTSGFGGGSISAGGTATIKNLIVASSTPRNCDGVSDDEGDTFDTDGTCGGWRVTLDQLGLGPLATNSGATQTHALLQGSVAIDAVKDCMTADDSLPVTIDQRDIERPQGNLCDAGAYEYDLQQDEDLRR